jgi:hypothetical protein
MDFDKEHSLCSSRDRLETDGVINVAASRGVHMKGAEVSGIDVANGTRCKRREAPCLKQHGSILAPPAHGSIVDQERLLFCS